MPCMVEQRKTERKANRERRRRRKGGEVVNTRTARDTDEERLLVVEARGSQQVYSLTSRATS